MSCNKCNKDLPIVNKKYGLCTTCNYIRLNGESKESVYRKRATEKALHTPRKIYTLRRSNPRRQTQKEQVRKQKLSEVKLQLEMQAVQNDEYFCKGCGCSYVGLDKSHILSVGQRKDLELDPANIRLHCRDCHMAWESWEIDRMAKLHCFESDVAYIQTKDIGVLNRILTRINEFLQWNAGGECELPEETQKIVKKLEKISKIYR